MPGRDRLAKLPPELRPADNGNHKGGRPRKYPHGQSPDELVRAALAEAQAIAAERLKERKRIPLTQELIDGIVGLVHEGNYADTAAASLGVPKSTFRQWMDRGETQWVQERTDDYDPEGMCAELYDAVTTAEAAWEIAVVADLEHKIERNSSVWSARMTQLERRDPARWGRREGGSGGSQSWDAQMRKLSKELARNDR